MIIESNDKSPLLAYHELLPNTLYRIDDDSVWADKKFFIKNCNTESINIGAVFCDLTNTVAFVNWRSDKKKIYRKCDSSVVLKLKNGE